MEAEQYERMRARVDLRGGVDEPSHRVELVEVGGRVHRLRDPDLARHDGEHERVVRVAASFREAEQMDREDLAVMTFEERISPSSGGSRPLRASCGYTPSDSGLRFRAGPTGSSVSPRETRDLRPKCP